MKNKKLESILDKIPDLAPVTYLVRLQGTLAVSLEHYAMSEGINAETIIAESVRAYLGDAI